MILLRHLINFLRILKVPDSKYYFIIWASVLSIVTGQNDFCIGVPIRQRNTSFLENTIGCYINMLCIRVRDLMLKNSLTVRSICNMCYKIRQYLALQDIPLSKILEQIKIERNERPPLFQALFALQDNHSPVLKFQGVNSTFIRQPYLELPIELHAEIWPSSNSSLELSLSYQTKYISMQLAEQLGTLFINTCRNILFSLS